MDSSFEYQIVYRTLRSWRDRKVEGAEAFGLMFSILFLLFYLGLMIFVIWFMITVVKNLKAQTSLLERMEEKLNFRNGPSSLE